MSRRTASTWSNSGNSRCISRPRSPFSSPAAPCPRRLPSKPRRVEVPAGQGRHFAGFGTGRLCACSWGWSTASQWPASTPSLRFPIWRRSGARFFSRQWCSSSRPTSTCPSGPPPTDPPPGRATRRRGVLRSAARTRVGARQARLGNPKEGPSCSGGKTRGSKAAEKAPPRPGRRQGANLAWVAVPTGRHRSGSQRPGQGTEKRTGSRSTKTTNATPLSRNGRSSSSSSWCSCHT
mmetsp:Transcript_60987/g.137923  ORF Transcript_60987/g.137923 Transcript_60987/m.137923 type:complete len:235 (+) Transcript_60987:1192-1896(+)